MMPLYLNGFVIRSRQGEQIHLILVRRSPGEGSGTQRDLSYVWGKDWVGINLNFLKTHTHQKSKNKSYGDLNLPVPSPRAVTFRKVNSGWSTDYKQVQHSNILPHHSRGLRILPPPTHSKFIKLFCLHLFVFPLPPSLFWSMLVKEVQQSKWQGS